MRPVIIDRKNDRGVSELLVLISFWMPRFRNDVPVVEEIDGFPQLSADDAQLLRRRVSFLAHKRNTPERRMALQLVIDTVMHGLNTVEETFRRVGDQLNDSRADLGPWAYNSWQHCVNLFRMFRGQRVGTVSKLLQEVIRHTTSTHKRRYYEWLFDYDVVSDSYRHFNDPSKAPYHSRKRAADINHLKSVQGFKAGDLGLVLTHVDRAVAALDFKIRDPKLRKNLNLAKNEIRNLVESVDILPLLKTGKSVDELKASLQPGVELSIKAAWAPAQMVGVNKGASSIEAWQKIAALLRSRKVLDLCADDSLDPDNYFALEAEAMTVVYMWHQTIDILSNDEQFRNIITDKTLRKLARPQSVFKFFCEYTLASLGTHLRSRPAVKRLLTLDVDARKLNAAEATDFMESRNYTWTQKKGARNQTLVEFVRSMRSKDLAKKYGLEVPKIISSTWEPKSSSEDVFVPLNSESHGRI